MVVVANMMEDLVMTLLMDMERVMGEDMVEVMAMVVHQEDMVDTEEYQMSTNRLMPYQA